MDIPVSAIQRIQVCGLQFVVCVFSRVSTDAQRVGRRKSSAYSNPFRPDLAYRPTLRAFLLDDTDSKPTTMDVVKIWPPYSSAVFIAQDLSGIFV